MSKSLTNQIEQQPARLYFLDWLRVLAVLGVFLFHAVHPFDFLPWHIKNAVQSQVITFILAFMFPWGMPFFFLLAGAGSWLAMRRRTAGKFARERFNRLLVPYIAGAILLMPIMLYFEWQHKLLTGMVSIPFMDFLLDRNVGFSPRWFGGLGYHLWFLGFLFAFSILALPVFLWLKGSSGQRLITQLVRICEHRGGILIFIIPLAIVRLVLHPFFPQEHDWADFFYQMSFFIFGFILFSRQGFLTAVRRDWRISLAFGIVVTVLAMPIAAANNNFDILVPPHTLLDFIFWTLVCIASWCWSLFVLYIGMRFLDFTNRYLDYTKEAILPFFVFHQPVIIILAFFAVQWQASLVIKLLFVVFSSFCVTLGIYEFLIRRSPALRLVFGMKVAPAAMSAG
jgi:glucan biosynthesis protein C